MKSIMIIGMFIIMLSGCATKPAILSSSDSNERCSVYVDTYHCVGLSYETKANAWPEAGFTVKKGTEALGVADLTEYEVLVLDQPWPARRTSLSESDMSAVMEYVAKGGFLFLLCEHRFCPGSPTEISVLTKSFGVTINEDWIDSDTVCQNTGAVPALAKLPDWTIEDMGSSISIIGTNAIPIYKTPSGLNTMVFVPFGQGYVLVAGDFESFGLDSTQIYAGILQFISNKK